MGRGAFVLLEGADRAGKTVQARRLVEYLTNVVGVPVQRLGFPDRSTAIGSVINAYLTQSKDVDDRVVHLLFSANRWEVANEMERLLESGTTLVVDRYAYSGVAFSAAKGLDVEWCKSPDLGLPAPDIVLFLDLPLKVAASRGGFGEERYETESMQSKVRKAFHSLIQPSWKVVDASRSIDDVHQELRNHVLQTIEIVKENPISRDLF